MKRSLLSLALLIITIAGYSQWTTMAPMTVARGQHGAVAHPNGKVYVFGGFALGSPFNDLEIYDQATNTWTTGASFPVAVRAMSFALGNDNKIYLFSGTDASNYNAACYKYDVSANTWTAIASIPTPVWESSAATASNGKIYVFGGENGENLVQIYDPTTDTWSTGANIPVPVLMPGVAAAPNGKIYVIGGIDASTFSSIGNVQIYDPVANTWTTGTSMPTSRNQFACVYAAGKIGCIGGKAAYGNNSTPFFATVELYDYTANSWTTITPLPQAIGELEAVYVNGGVNVFGGTNGSYLNTNYRMDVNVGVQEQEAGHFSLFPNPSAGMVNISFAEANNEVLQVLDATGRLVFEKQMDGSLNASLDLGSLAQGIYVVKVGEHTEKLMISGN